MRIGRAVWEGGSWAIGDAITKRDLAELSSREARIAALVVKYAIEAGILVLVDTAPEIIALRLVVALAKELRAYQGRA